MNNKKNKLEDLLNQNNDSDFLDEVINPAPIHEKNSANISREASINMIKSMSRGVSQYLNNNNNPGMKKQTSRLFDDLFGPSKDSKDVKQSPELA